MSAFTKLGDYTNGTVADGNELTAEFNNIYNALNGVSSDKEIAHVFSGSSPALLLSQLSTGDILQLIASGVVRWRVAADGSIRDVNGNEVLDFSAVVSAINFLRILNAAAGNPVQIQAVGDDTNIDINLVTKGTGKVILPANNPTDNNHATRKAYVDGKKTAFSIAFFEPDPSISTAVNEDRACWVCPDGNGVTITKLFVKFTAGSHTSGGTLTFTFRKRAGNGGSSVDIGSISLDNTNFIQHVVYKVDISDVPLSPDDTITYYISHRSGTTTERSVSLGFYGTQTVL